MKRTIVLAAALCSFALMLWLFAQTPPSSPPQISRFIPTGPALYLEARNFGALLNDWNGSNTKQLWLKSDNFEVFSRSRLFLKLQRAQAEFAAAAGIPADMDLLSNVAGTESAVAIYDIGQLEFLYITHLSTEKFAGGALWKTRGNYQPRRSSGIDYYIKTDPASKRTAGFAVAKDYVVLATREDILAGALALIAGQNQSSVADQGWFSASTRQAQSQGDLRMVMNLEMLTRSPHFRSYWIQQNITDLKQYSAGISDASQASGQLREDRVLLRGSEIKPEWNEPAVAELMHLASSEAGIVRAWASPSGAEAFDLIRRKILAPHPAAAPVSKLAPVVALNGGETGDESDLETHIDEPPLQTGTPEVGIELRKLIDGSKIQAMLYAASTRVQPDGVFVGADSAVALLNDSDWDSTAVRNAIAAGIARLVSIGDLGAHWNSRGSGSASYSELDGLLPLAVAVRGRLLVVATSTPLLESMLAGSSQSNASSANARYAAIYRHSRELVNFIKMTRLIDNPLVKPSSSDAPEPSFFSGNIASLGSSLAAIDSESIIVHDSGAMVTQNLVYQLK